MTKFLANAMGLLNRVIALLIVATTLAFGLLVYGTVTTVILSLVIGITIAALVYGLIVISADIRNEMFKTKLVANKQKLDD